ncbi:MAG: YfiR family protein [Acidobacteriota bacterium]
MAFLGYRLRIDKLKSARDRAPARGRVYIAALCLCVVLISGAMRPAVAQEGAGEYEVKAAFLFNFVKFVDWPEDAFADARSPVVIGIFGQDPFNGALDRAVSGKTVNGRPLIVKRLGQEQDARLCHILFICPCEKKRLPQLLASLTGASVLTISETDDFLPAGGVIKFVIENNRVRFDISAIAAGQARLRISSKLLQLARAVTR